MESDSKDRGTSTGSAPLQPFRVFLASPGDVPLERKLAREAITHICSERRFRNRIDIEIIAWDQPGATVAMEAGLTPQEAFAQGLPKPEECDLAVIVLWSRIGTPLPTDFEMKPDGTPYLSGTEWEYLNALKGFRSSRKPFVWVYRRLLAPQFSADDPELEHKLDQWRKVSAFFANFSNPDGSNSGGINEYETPDDFRQRFEQHLRDRLDKLLESQSDIQSNTTKIYTTDAPVWNASPYPGLEAFRPDQAPIFFGRGAEIDQLLQQFTDQKVRFVAVVGVSGSGKSSLVQAGLLPRLRSGIVGNTQWTDLIFKPGERGGNPYLALAYLLKTELAISGQSEKEIARVIQADSGIAIEHLTQLIMRRKPATELLLVVDQFEELFTQTLDSDRDEFIALLNKLVAQPGVRVIVTLRADFYTRAIEEPALAGLLRRDRGTFPLDAPGVGAIHQMIIRPAEAAGVELEDGLAQRLLDDAGQGPGAMALIAFTLHQLYEKEQASDYLSITAYNAIGGVRGAVQTRAESALQGMVVNFVTTLPKLFSHLVEVNEQEIATRSRVLQSVLQGEVKRVAIALTEARLLMTGKGEADQPTLEVAHETVLTGWERLRQWIVDHAELLRGRRDLELAAAEWERAKGHSSALRTGKLLLRYLNAAEPHSATAKRYLTACKMRRYGFRFVSGLSGMLIIAILGILLNVSQSDYSPGWAAHGLFVNLGVWPVGNPKMEPINIGEFNMGDLTTDGGGDIDEQPVHTVTISYEFEMGRYEVTFDEYDLFAAATGRNKPNDEGWGRGQRPVINVSWEDAVAYAEWLSERIGEHYRLPTEAEWEYAARAGTETPRYWPEPKPGEPEPACLHANVFDANNLSRIKRSYPNIDWKPFDCEDEFPFTAPVGKLSPNQWGLHDTLGNVWEWTQDCYVESYVTTPRDGTAWVAAESGECVRRVLRGGSWSLGPRYLRSADRGRDLPDNRSNSVGFRLARTL